MKWAHAAVFFTLSLALPGCGEESADGLDCRNEGRGCNAAFSCIMNASGGYECQPDGAAHDGGVALDMSRSGDGTVSRPDGGSAEDAGQTMDGDVTQDAQTPMMSDAAVDQGSGPPTMTGVEIRDRQLLVDGEPFHIKGVNWNPVPRGGVHPQDIDFSGFVEQDAVLMQAAGINLVRTYETILDSTVLDVLHQHGIYVMSTVYIWGGAPVDSVIEKVNATKNHPAILMWAVGNEWNYNGLYNGLSFDESLNRVGEAARLIKQHDPSRPVATIYGEMPSEDVIARLPDIDTWGLNVYRGIGFGDLFDTFASRSEKPMFLGEYGADAYNANIDAEDQAAQAEATRVLTEAIVSESAVNGGPCIGGVIFEWADEWWKSNGDPNVHDTGGAAPGGGPHPDGVFNEEWWGIVDVDRVPRAAYEAYGDVASP